MRGSFKNKLYDKRNDFNFHIVNFPLIWSNIPAAPVYGVYISQLIRFSRACGSYQDFLDRGKLLTRKLLNQWFLLVKLKSSLLQTLLEDTTGVIRIRKSKKDWQHNGQKKKDKGQEAIYKTYITYTHKTKDWETWTPLTTEGELRCTGRVGIWFE
jgi:hypothetical protein